MQVVEIAGSEGVIEWPADQGGLRSTTPKSPTGSTINRPRAGGGADIGMRGALTAFWLGGIGFATLSHLAGEGPRSPFWFTDLALFGLMAALYFRDRPLAAGPRVMAAAFIGLSVVFGMVYEIGLTVTGEGIGGVHPQTRASFILAQGDYWALAIVALCLVRWLRLDFGRMVWVAGGMSLTEGLIFTGVLTQTLLSGLAPFSPFVLAYYTLAYACFIAMPLLIVQPRTLWAGPETGSWRWPALWAIGFVAAFVVRLFWGLVWGPFATWAFNLPANPL